MSKTHYRRFIGFEELKRFISMEQVLRRYGLLERLRRSGQNLSGVCPLHHGHNPTQFRVSLSKNCWICFGDCHSGGSIIDFVSRVEGIGIREAALRLHEWFNLPNGAEAKSGGAKAQPPGSLRQEALCVIKGCNTPLGFTLQDLDETHPYLKSRGLSEETIATFGVGWCAHGSLRGWIAIPIHDCRGRLLAYAGRWPGTPPEGLPKYRLPRGFRKSLELFNQHRAANGPMTDPLVITEGFFGCMHVWQAGYRRVVALMGSVLSQAQERRIIALAGSSRQVQLLFDEDPAGRRGRSEAARRLGKSVSVSVLKLPEGQQPDGLSSRELVRLLASDIL